MPSLYMIKVVKDIVSPPVLYLNHYSLECMMLLDEYSEAACACGGSRKDSHSMNGDGQACHHGLMEWIDWRDKIFNALKSRKKAHMTASSITLMAHLSGTRNAISTQEHLLTTSSARKIICMQHRPHAISFARKVTNTHWFALNTNSTQYKPHGTISAHLQSQSPPSRKESGVHSSYPPN